MTEPINETEEITMLIRLTEPTAPRYIYINYSIKLRPREQDSVSNIVNPMFTINRTNDATGKPLSVLYNALHTAFPNAAIAPLNPR